LTTIGQQAKNHDAGKLRREVWGCQREVWRGKQSSE